MRASVMIRKWAKKFSLRPTISRQQVGDFDGNLGQFERRHFIGARENFKRGIIGAVFLSRVGLRFAAHFESVTAQVEEPIISNALRCVEAGFFVLVVGQSRERDFHDKHRECGNFGKRIQVGFDNGDVGQGAEDSPNFSVP